MNILSTFAFDATNPGNSVVRHVVTDSPVASITGPNGDMEFILVGRANKGGSYDYLVVAGNGGLRPNGNYTVTGEDGSSAETYALFGDLNGDRTVDSSDQTAFDAAYGLSAGQPGFNDQCDLLGKGTVNLYDQAQFTNDMGQTLNP